MTSLHHVVLASAGTGKTYSLTTRLVGLLVAAAAQGGASGVLATTFTRKAAGEIFQRLLTRIVDAIDDKDARASLTESLGSGVSEQGLRDVLRYVAEHSRELNVQTIDSWFLSNASTLALELGLSPGWGIVSQEEHEQQVMEAIERVVRHTPVREMSIVLDALQGGRPGAGVLEPLERAVGEGVTAFGMARGEKGPWVRIGPMWEAPTTADLERAIEGLGELDLPKTKGGTPRKAWSGAVGKLDAVARAGQWDEVLDQLLVRRIATGELTFGGSEIPEEIATHLEPIVRMATFEFLTKLRHRNAAIYDVIAKYQETIQGLKRQSGKLSFDDVPRLLAEFGIADRLEELYFRLDARVQHVLLDEFQDTSLTQFELLRPMLDEVMSHGDGSHSFFCVGDAKQSLYTWREAEPRLLGSLSSQWPQIETSHLSKSFRSAPAVIETVNRVFEHVSVLPCFGIASSQTQAMLAAWDRDFDHHETAKTELTGRVELRTGTALWDHRDRKPALEGVREAVCRHVGRILDMNSDADVGVLVRSNKCVRTTIDALHRAGIDASEEGGAPLSDAPAASAALSLLLLTDHPGDSAAAHHVAQSPLGSVVGLGAAPGSADRMRVASAIRRRLASDGYGDTIAWLQRETAGSMDRAAVGRFEQLVTLAEEFDGRWSPRASEFVSLARSRAVEGQRSAAVRVMTVHKSKGLEFDAVVLCELHSPWAQRNRVLMSRPGPGALPEVVTAAPRKELLGLHPELVTAAGQTEARGYSQEVCGLYVAMTRARQMLTMIIPPRDRGTSETIDGARVLTEAFGVQDREADLDATLFESPGSVPLDEVVLGSAREGERDSREGVRGRVRVPSSSRGVHRLQEQSPSGLTRAKSVSIDSVLPGEGRQGAMSLGTGVHACFEQVEWADGSENEKWSSTALEPLLREIGLDDDECERAIGVFEAAIGVEEVAESLSRRAYDGRAEEVRVYRERNFAAIVRLEGKELLLRGVFDRLVIGLQRGKPVFAEVLDFKTDRVDAESIADVVDHHRPQMRAYREAAATMLGLDLEDVSVKLVLTGIGRVVDAIGEAV